jgi:perosamine synthetase
VTHRRGIEPVEAPTAGYVPLCVPELGGNEWRYVKECLDSTFVSSVGPFVDRFEQMIAARLGARGAVATSSGTAALHVALIVAGIRPGDEVLVPSLTFIAPVNAIRYVGAVPVFVDAEPRYWQMDVAAARRYLETECERDDGPQGATVRNRATGRAVRAILPVHLLGTPVDFDPLAALAQEFGLVTIEDATESLGAEYRGRPVGRLGDIGCFSFNGNKVITAGGGGLIVTDRQDWADRARYLTTQAKDHPLEFVHGEIGFNYRLPAIQAALGCAQAERLDQHLQAKRAVAERYRAALDGTPGLTTMAEPSYAAGACWMFTVLVDEARFGCGSRDLIAQLDRDRIQARPLWQPNHRSAAHADAPARACPVADRLYEQAVTLPSSSGLTEADQQRVIDSISRAVRRGRL